MDSFVYVAHPTRVVFGSGAVSQLPHEVELLGLNRALILSTPGHADLAQRLAATLGERTAGIYAKAVMHVPVQTAREAGELARRLQADGTIAVGGGSTTGLGKAIALELRLPIVAVPTTYSGSEMTPIYGLTEGGRKRTGRDLIVLPRTVIYDPELTLTLPMGLTVTSAMNAMAHAAEGLYGQHHNPVSDLMAEEGIRALARALPRLRSNPLDLSARSDALYGAWLCGMVLSAVGMALHHKLCHTLGGSFNLPHAEVHTVVLPHAIAYNAPAIPAALERMMSALGTGNPAQGLYDLACTSGAPSSLRALGLRESDLDRAADLAVENAYWNPKPVEREGVRALIQSAWEGRRPE